MTWSVTHLSYDTTAELTDTSVSQGLKFDDNYVITAMRAWLVLVGNPTFNNMRMLCYGNDDQAAEFTPTEVIQTSSTQFANNSEILFTEAHGIKEVYFQFDDLYVRKGTVYNFVINADCYFPTVTSYIGWKKAWPDPVALIGYTPTAINVNTGPLEIYAYGAKL